MREIRTLRATWRGLETWCGSGPPGHTGAPALDPTNGRFWRRADIRLPATDQFACGGVSQCKPLRWFWPERSRRWPTLPPDSDPARRNGNRPPEGSNFRGRTALKSGRSCRSACGRTTSPLGSSSEAHEQALTLNLRKENHGTTSLTRTPWQFVAEMAYARVSSVICINIKRVFWNVPSLSVRRCRNARCRDDENSEDGRRDWRNHRRAGRCGARPVQSSASNRPAAKAHIRCR